MNMLELYEKVSLVTPVEQRRFYNAYEDSINELLTLYDDKFVFDSDKGVSEPNDKAWISGDLYYPVPQSLTVENVALPLYDNAIVDNILYICSTGDGRETFKTEFIRKSRYAYLKYWHANAKGRRVKRRGW